jgi:hypothetical protein
MEVTKKKMRLVGLDHRLLVFGETVGFALLSGVVLYDFAHQ